MWMAGLGRVEFGYLSGIFIFKAFFRWIFVVDRCSHNNCVVRGDKQLNKYYIAVTKEIVFN